MEEGLTYKEAGVDIEAAKNLIDRIKPLVKSTFRPEVIADIGGFGALFSLNKERYQKPVLVSASDGVGTKLKIAFMMDKHDTIGIDLVAMCVNDLITQGAEPLFFLDYLATSKLDPSKATEIIRGIVQGCLNAGCSLIGGETAELPGFYQDKEYDLAGFALGIVERDKIIDGSSITVGNKLVGIASSGLHSNGFSLVRKVIFEKLKLGPKDRLPKIGKTVGEELLTPTKIYVKTIHNLIRDFDIKGIAHITGGGLLENIPRILPHTCQALIQKESWPTPFIFKFIQENGKVGDEEMLRTFNLGMGMVLVTPEEETEEILVRLKGLQEEAYLIGEIIRREKEEEAIKWA